MEMLELEARQRFGIHLTGSQMIGLKTLEHELLAWNENVNLTAIQDRRGSPYQTLSGFILLRSGLEGKSSAKIDRRWNRCRFPGPPAEDPLPWLCN